MNSKIIIFAGRLLLSTLLAFILFSIAQWLTVSLDLIIFNIIGLFLIFIVQGLAFNNKESLIGTIILIITILYFQFDSGTFHFLPLIFVLLGLFLGVMLQRKSYKQAITLFLISMGMILYLKKYHYSKIYYSKLESVELNDLNEKGNYLIGYNLRHPNFGKDTVYLFNFSFNYCQPCRIKKDFLKEIDDEFKERPFKIINVHNIESLAFFNEKYQLEFGESYHDMNDSLSLFLKIEGYPKEYIFNKNGDLARVYDGFMYDNSRTYLSETITLINKLINEN